MSASLLNMKGRKAPPSHFLFKINSFSLLSKASVNKVSSEEFEAGGYKWRLFIYPNGNKERGGQDHVSIYLQLSLPSSLPIDWELNAIVNFSVYNFLEDQYVATQDASVRCFRVLKNGWGIAKFIDLNTFNDPSKGYLVGDICVFGAEVFVVKKTSNRGSCLSMIHQPVTYSHSWKFNNFSLSNLDKYESQPFLAGNYKWTVHLYPNGTLYGKHNSVSLFLVLDPSTLLPNTKLLVDYTLRVKDQIGKHHVEMKACSKFSSSRLGRGSMQLLPLAKFKDPNNGFLVGDSCIFEAELTIVGLINS